MSPQKLAITLLILTIPLSAHAGELRNWTNKEGRTTRAEFLGLEGDSVKLLLPNGQNAATPLANLSDADQNWVKARTEKPAVTLPPAVIPESPKPKPSPLDQPKEINWAPLKDLGMGILALPPIPEPSADALIPVNSHSSNWSSFYMRPDGSNAFPHLGKIKSHLKPFSDGLAYVWVGDLKGYINREGKWVIGGDSPTPLPVKGADYEAFSEGLAAYRDGNRSCCGYIDTRGKVVIQSETYFMAKPFSHGLAAVNTSQKLNEQAWQYIDRNGKVVIPGPWARAQTFEHGVAWVGLDQGSLGVDMPGRMRLITPTGKFVFGDAVFLSSNTSIDTSAGFVCSGRQIQRVDGTMLIEGSVEYTLTNFSSDGQFAVAIMGSNNSRLVHIPSMSVYGPAIRCFITRAFSEGLMPVHGLGEQKNPWHVYDRSGKPAFETRFYWEPVFQDGFAVTSRDFGEKEPDLRTVVVNRKGDIVWKAEVKKK